MFLYHAKLKHQRAMMIIQDITETAYLDNSQNLDVARTLYEKLMSRDVHAEEACSYNALEKNSGQS